MSKTKKNKIELEDKSHKKYIKHYLPKRLKTRQKEEENWREEYDLENLSIGIKNGSK